jgi:hypothetical protein
VTVRRAFIILCLAVIVATGIDLRLLRMPFIDRKSRALSLAGLEGRSWPQYSRFLDGVRAHTRPGDTIAVVVPAMGWDDGYRYAYYRASYFLTGREVLPLVDPQNGRIPRNLRAARYIAAFGMRLRVPASVVWQGDGGALLRLQ